MILINENKIKVGAFGLNTEKVLIIINHFQVMQQKNASKELENVIRFNFMPVNYEAIKQGVQKTSEIDILQRIETVFLPDNYEVNYVSVLKLLKTKIISEFNLKKDDFSLISQANWTHLEMKARVQIPSKIVPKNAGLLELISKVEGLIESGHAFEYSTDNSFILYFRMLLPEDKAILEQSDIVNSILIEEI